MISEEIAIIGMSGRFPQAQSLSQFVENLRRGTDSVRPITSSRLARTGLSSDQSYKEFAFIEDIDSFDFDFFGIAKSEAELMDPHQRMILEVVYETLENSGYPIEYFSGSNTSVYVGDTQQSYHALAKEYNPLLVTGSLNAITAGRISRTFNLTGSSMMVDTACSSSLMALHLACQELRCKGSDLALVCGVKLVIIPPNADSLDEMGIISPGGRCRSFSADADGIGGGEAVCSVLLKPLQQALKSSDIIHAIIKGTAVNQDAARSLDLTSPSATAQAEVIKKAWEISNVSPETISYIEAHGTGTKVGDPIEIDGIVKAFDQFTKRSQFCSISSVKSNIGHTDGAAGLASVLKVIQSLKYKELYPSVNFTDPNPLIDLISSPVYVSNRLEPWKTNGFPRRAGISSFSFSGTNCHAVLEEFQSVSETIPSPRDEKYLIMVSSKNAEGLMSNLKVLREFFVSHIELPLCDVSYTLSVGRTHYNHRACFQATDLKSAITQIDNCLDNKQFRPVKRESYQWWIYFDHQLTLSYEQFLAILGKYRSFADEYQRLIMQGQIDIQVPSQRTLLFQCCLYKLLDSLGVQSDNLMGNGAGKIAIQLIRRQIDLPQALARVSDFQASGQEVNLKKRIKNFIAGNQYALGIIDLGQELKALNSLESEFPNVKIVSSDAIENCVPELLQRLYLNGQDIKWIHLIVSGKKIELPSYQFRKTRCWINEATARSIENCFYSVDWRPVKAETTLPIKNQILVVFTDKDGLGEKVVDLLESSGNKCVVVQFASKFEEETPTLYKLDPGREEHFENLRKKLDSIDWKISGVLFTQNFGASRPPDSENIEETLKTNILPQIFFAKVFRDYLQEEGFGFTQISTNANRLREDTYMQPENTMSVSVLKSLLSEFNSLLVTHIDFDYDKIDHQSIARIVVEEMSSIGLHRFVSYRNGERFLPFITSRKVSTVNYQFMAGATYVVVGGLGKVGRHLCERIMTMAKCTIIIIGQNELRNQSSEKQAVFKSLLNKSIEKECQLLYFKSDISKVDEAKAVVNAINGFGLISGIFNCGGTVPKSSLANLNADLIIRQMSAKIQGNINLKTATRGSELQFIVMFSSINALVPDKNSLVYAMSNSFQDAYVFSSSDDDTSLKSINWGIWNDNNGKDIINEGEGVQAHSMKDGLDALEIAMSIPDRNIIFSKVDLKGFKQNPFYEIDIDYSPVVEDSIETTGATSETEKILHKIWVEILKSASFGLDDNFFKIGGHSLLGLQIINRIDKLLKKRIHFKDILKNPTVKLLAKFLDNRDVSGSVDFDKSLGKEHYELSPAQKRLWLLHERNPHEIAYNVPGAYIIEGDLILEALFRAISELVARHEVLRTVFKVMEGRPMQKILSDTDHNRYVQYVDLRQQSDHESECARIIQADIQHQFNMAEGPLIFFKLIHQKDHEFVFLYVMHHIIADAWSMDIFFRDFVTLYNAFSSNKPSPLQPLRVQYKEFALSQLEYASGREFINDRNYWLGRFSEPFQYLQFPLDFNRLQKRTYAGASATVVIDKVQLEQLHNLANEQNASLFMVLLATMKAVFFYYSGQNDILVGTLVSTRNGVDYEEQIGFHINSLPLRTKFDPDSDFLDLLGNTKETLLGALEHQNYPFDTLVEDLGLRIDQNQTPLFDIMVQFLNDPSYEPSVISDSLKIKPIGVNFNFSKFDFEISFNSFSDSVFCVVQYNKQLFEKSSIDLFCKRFKVMLGIVLLDSHESSIRQLCSKMEASIQGNGRMGVSVNLKLD